MSPAALARAWLAWLDDRPGERPDVGLALITPDFLWTERPTRFGRRGRSGDVRTLLAALDETAAMIDGERITERRLICAADAAVIEVEWTGTLRSSGATLRADGVMVLTVADARISAARDYLCFDG